MTHIYHTPRRLVNAYHNYLIKHEATTYMNKNEDQLEYFRSS